MTWTSTLPKKKNEWQISMQNSVQYHYPLRKYRQQLNTPPLIKMIKIKQIDNTKYQEWETTGTLICCCLKYKMVQGLWKIVIYKKFLEVIDIFSIQPSNPTFRYLSKRNENLCSYICVTYSSFMHNCPKLELTQMSINWWVDQQTEV